MASISSRTCGSLRGSCGIMPPCRPGSCLPRRSSFCLPPPLPNSCRSGGYVSTHLPPPNLGSPCVPPPCIPPPPRPLNLHPGGEGILNCNEKETMEDLNCRLGNYLEKVRCLEKENADLECKIREWFECENAYVCTDFKQFYCNIEELEQKICCVKADNARLCLGIDNLKMANDDYCTKYQHEVSLRQRDECDINGLRRVLDGLTLCKSDLETQLESLSEEMACLKKNHEEESCALRSQLGNHISVEVAAPPSCNLNKVLDEMRCQYESEIEKNRQETEAWYREKMDQLNREVISSGEQLQSCQSEIAEGRRRVQNLEIDLQAQQSMKNALECTLQETEERYCTQLSQLQTMVSNTEATLAEIRCDIERQNCEYKTLLDEKARLDCEIATYRNMLEGEDHKLPERPCDPECPTAIRSSVCQPVCVPEPTCAPSCPPTCAPSVPVVEPSLAPSCVNPCGPVHAPYGPPPCGPCGPVCPPPCGPRINTRICPM
ncbi:keratin, type I cuticular Ha4 [Pogona vitticeps]